MCAAITNYMHFSNYQYSLIVKSNNGIPFFAKDDDMEHIDGSLAEQEVRNDRRRRVREHVVYSMYIRDISMHYLVHDTCVCVFEL